MSATTPIQQLNRDLADQLVAQAKQNPSAFAGRFVGIANGQVVVVADSLQNVHQVRAEIFRIHLDKRGHASAQFDLPGLAAASPSFSGAEIEQSIVAASYTAYAEKKPLAGTHVLQELRSTRPLAVLRAEEVASFDPHG